MRVKSNLLFVFTIALFFVASSAYAGTVRGKLNREGPEGTLSALYVPVTLYSKNTQQRSEPEYTRSDGMYIFNNFTPGEYILEIWAQGFNNKPIKYNIQILDQPFTDIKPILITSGSS